MGVIKVNKKENPYAQVDKAMLNRPDMSWQAKGMLSYLLSKPEDWETNIKDIIRKGKNQRDSVYSIMDELMELGYIRRSERRTGGKFDGYDYDVYDSPYTEKPDTGKPDTDSPDTENPDNTNIDNSTKNESTNPPTPNGESEAKVTEQALYSEFIRYIASKTKKGYRGDSTSRRSFGARLKDGYTLEQMKAAVNTAAADEYHAKKTSYKYLTPEYILRPAQMEKWVTAAGPAFANIAEGRKQIGWFHTRDFFTDAPVTKPVYEGDKIPMVGFQRI